LTVSCGPINSDAAAYTRKAAVLWKFRINVSSGAREQTNCKVRNYRRSPEFPSTSIERRQNTCTTTALLLGAAIQSLKKRRLRRRRVATGVSPDTGEVGVSMTEGNGLGDCLVSRFT